MTTDPSKSAAARFYQASHDRLVRSNPDVSFRDVSAAAGLQAISKPGHRYYCVYEHLSRHPGQNVVELGFGSPALINAVAATCSHITIVDIVDRTQSVPLSSNVRLRVANLDDQFPFDDAEFDCVCAMMVVEHLFDPFHAFREIARILKVGGHAFVNLPNIASIRCRLQLLAGRMPITSSYDWFEKQEWDGNHLHYFTVAEVSRLGRLNGLDLLRPYPVGRFRFLKSCRPTLLCHEISYAFLRTG